MPRIDLMAEQLVLDNDNPRITHASGQQEALQKVVKDQSTKLLRLAESIVENGLSPIERLMVLEVSSKPKRYIALEGNRRVTALKLLTNPAVMTGLEMPESLRRSIERLAAVFEKTKVEPVECFEVGSREDGRYWIELRHNGEDDGRGVVAWKPFVAARYRKREPAIQALDLVLEHGGFSEDESEAIRSKFSLTTLRRVVDSEDARRLLGLTIKDGQLQTSLPGREIIKPLKKLVRDIAEKTVNSRSFNKTENMTNYINAFEKADRPDLSKRENDRSLEGIQKTEFIVKSPKASKPRLKSPAARGHIVPRNCNLNVTDNRIGEIYHELQTLKLTDARNAIAVLLRVFLEMSVDHFLEANGVSLKFSVPSRGEKYKSLDKKLSETVEMLVSNGASRDHFVAVIRSLDVKTSPMNIELFHLYVHDRFATPSPQELTAAWNNAQPFFEKIWP